MDFKKITLKEEFQVKRLISLHYFEFARDYLFEGEKHDFWEFLYVDKGEVEILADQSGYRLKQGDIIFHKPNEFHSAWANKKIAPNLVVIAFECQSEAMKFLERKIFELGDGDRNILATIISEGTKAFLPPLDQPDVNDLQRNARAPFACEQIIKIQLERLLINMVRNESQKNTGSRLSTLAKQRTEDDIIKRINRYMAENLSSALSLDQIGHFLNIGRTHLKTLFKAKTGMGVLEYFRIMKIDKAKVLIREEQFNFSEIAEILGYANLQSFSRYFKNLTGVAPSEYAKTIKAQLNK